MPIIPSFLYKLRHDEKTAELSTNAEQAKNYRLVDRANEGASNSNLKPGLLNKFGKERTYPNGRPNESEPGIPCPKDDSGRESSKGKNKLKNSRIVNLKEEEPVTSSDEDYEDEPQTEEDRRRAERRRELEEAERIVNNETAKQVIKHQELVEESTEVGVMFASKPIIQALVNPAVGHITNKIGYSIPMFAGFIIMFLSTLIFAMGSTYPVLLGGFHFLLAIHFIDHQG